MNRRKHKRGQASVLLVLILAGLTLLFALNVDIFTSSRSKIRLQNAADASAIAIARWQGMTLNMIGDLNIAHLAAICQSNATAISGIVALQGKLALLGPTIGFKAANDIAEINSVRVSDPMTQGTDLISGFMSPEYRNMLNPIIKRGIRAGIDNAAVIRAGSVDLRLDPDFYEAIRDHDFRTLCSRYSNGRHQLPEVPHDPLDPKEIALSGENACFGSVGIRRASGFGYEWYIDEFEDMARTYGIPGSIVNRKELRENAALFSEFDWYTYDMAEWRDLPDEFSISRFPWLTPMRQEFAVCGGSATVRVEGSVALSSIAAQTNFITAQAAAKAFGSVNGRKVTEMNPPIVLPSFTRVRLVPFAPGAAGRYGMADINHIRSILGLLGSNKGGNSYLSLLEYYNGEAFRSAAEAWYSQHGHDDIDGCAPPSPPCNCKGECTCGKGGGTPYGI